MKILLIMGTICSYCLEKGSNNIDSGEVPGKAKTSKNMNPKSDYIDAKSSELEKPRLVKGNAKMGLQNTGLTCYFNSALNSLYFVPQFHHFFSAEEQPSDPQLIVLLKRFVRNYGKKDLPRDLLTSIRHAVPSYRHERMGSAYEFILSLLQRADEEVGSYVEMDSVLSGEAWERELANTETLRLSVTA